MSLTGERHPPAVAISHARPAAAAMLVVAPTLSLVAALAAPSYADRGERLRAVAADPGAFAVATTAQVIALPFALAAVVLISLLTFAGSPRLAVLSGVLGTAGVLGHAVVVGVELMTDAVAAGGPDLARLTRIDADLAGPPVIAAALLFLPLSVLGFVLRTVALWRSPAVPRALAVVFGLWLVVDLGGSDLAASALSLGTYAWLAVVVLGATGAEDDHRSRSATGR